jgi:hypothetical protein
LSQSRTWPRLVGKTWHLQKPYDVAPCLRMRRFAEKPVLAPPWTQSPQITLMERKTSAPCRPAERPAAPIDERGSHAGRFRIDAIESVVRDEGDLVRRETESLGRESKHPDPASASFTAMLVSLGQTAPAILSTDNETIRFSDMVLITKVGSRCIGTPFAAVATCHRPKDWPLLLSRTRVTFFISCSCSG